MKLKELRIKNNLKQQDVAKYLNKTKSGYGYYETGRTEPDIKALCKLADLYHVSLDELVGREHNNFIDKSLLTNEQINIINNMNNLNKSNIDKLYGYTVALLQNQTDEQNIITKFNNKGEN